MPIPRNVEERIKDHMDAICRMFVKGARVSVVVRSPHLNDADVYISADDPNSVIAAVRRLAKVSAEERIGDLEDALRAAWSILERTEDGDGDPDLQALLDDVKEKVRVTLYPASKAKAGSGS